MEVLRFRVLKGGFVRFAEFLIDLCASFSQSTKGDSQKRRLFIWSVSNTQGVVRCICEMLSVGSLSICGGPKSKSSTSEEVGRRNITHMFPAEG